MKEFYELSREYVICDCYSELLQLVYDDDPEEQDDFLYVSMFRDWNGKSTWRKRLRHIWYILRHGEPWADQITLNKHEIKKLKDFLIKIDKTNTERFLRDLDKFEEESKKVNLRSNEIN